MDESKIPDAITDSAIRQIDPESWDLELHISNYMPQHGRSHDSWLHRDIPDLQLIVVQAGRVELSYDDKNESYIASPGQVLFIEPARQHSVQFTDESGRLSSIHFEALKGKQYANNDYRFDIPIMPLTTNLDGRFIDDCFRLCARHFQQHGQVHERISHSLLENILLQLRESALSDQTPGSAAQKNEFIAYIHEHLTDPIDRHSLAAAFHYTPEHINYCFRQQFDATPQQVIHRERCLRAIELLRSSNDSIKDIAEQVGYPDQFHFSRVFKKIIGLSPRDARKS